MLLKFEFENFRSFSEHTTVSMKAASLKDKKNRLIEAEDKEYLPFAAVYGPNASGKSNFVKAFDFLRGFILEGKLPTQVGDNERNVYDYLSFFHDYETYQKPTSFHIEFLTEKDEIKYLVNYKLTIESRIQQDQHIRRVLNEALSVNKKDIFERNIEKIYLYSNISTTNDNKNINDLMEDMLQKNLNHSDLFLANGYRNSIDKEIADIIINWFLSINIVNNRIGYRSNYDIKHLDSDDKLNDIGWYKKIWNPFIQLFDNTIKDIRYVNPDKNKKLHVLFTLHEMKDNPEEDMIFPAVLFESQGTIKFVELIELFLLTLKTGSLLIFDEIDCSLHPEIVAGIISVFNDPDINDKGSQLIVTTHNPVFLNQKLLRRDQIWFVDKDSDTNISELYRLSDFGTKIVRNDTDIYMHYLLGDYGALPVVDMRGAFREAMEGINVALKNKGESSDATENSTEK